MSSKVMRPCDYDDGYDDEPTNLPARPGPLELEEPPWKPYPEDNRAVAGLDDLLSHLRRRVDLTKVCDSPIEIDLGAALVEQAGERYRVVPQFRLLRYRYDFAIVDEGKVPLVLVECDGAEFHSTSEQLANDRAKDAAAVKLGTRVIRVTGKEIYHNPQAWAAFILGECRLEERRRGDQ